MSISKVKPAEGKLGVMVVGCGAVSTTFMTGVINYDMNTFTLTF